MEYAMINGKMSRVDYKWEMPNDNLKSTRNIMDVPMHPVLQRKSNTGIYLKSSLLAVAPVATTIVSKGVFWSAFLTYIFPWMLDLSKVFCAIKIAQGFYQENKMGGRDGNSGMGAVVTYGKWYLIFWMIPWLVSLIDQIGQQMFNELNQ